MKQDITPLFVFLDDFCNEYDKFCSQNMLTDRREKKLTRVPSMTVSEVLTIMLLWHNSCYDTFKAFYLRELPRYKNEFPVLVSYQRFVELKKRCLPYLELLLHICIKNAIKTNIYFIDSTVLETTSDTYSVKAKYFQGKAAKGKKAKGYFIGIKMHLVINIHGEIISVQLTPGNVDDRVPVPELVNNLTGMIFGDKGYIKEELTKDLKEQGLKLITPIKKNMKPIKLTRQETLLLRRRPLIESSFNYLKNKLKLTHTRHRSFANFVVHTISCLVNYCVSSAKPHMKPSFGW